VTGEDEHALTAFHVGCYLYRAVHTANFCFTDDFDDTDFAWDDGAAAGVISVWHFRAPMILQHAPLDTRRGPKSERADDRPIKGQKDPHSQSFGYSNLFSSFNPPSQSTADAHPTPSSSPQSLHSPKSSP
jgi:hypothetical protein